MTKDDPNGEVQRALGRVEAKVDMLLTANETAREKCDACEKRFQGLETSRDQLKGVALAVSVIVSALGIDRLSKIFH